ncbi:hypothetical protein HETIRDRAFT_102382 [Heterobasidion irregulare TC 32-1]|uniref:Uncharacterized protein n=1 Tax=Heterobasidion irregulare (strain TC 32-1) TaxID=747525 RepID=W4KCX2_HETIT|nr:uncharacterized protein HETIRDRAFT_102382 [Heterobasidion irregulare TC 32-1]ETW83707.1 hypothetical protein HETIRDRAFT_102382 [Heterobasidion irregulare TC 32-1]
MMVGLVTYKLEYLTFGEDQAILSPLYFLQCVTGVELRTSISDASMRSPWSVGPTFMAARSTQQTIFYHQPDEEFAVSLAALTPTGVPGALKRAGNITNFRNNTIRISMTGAPHAPL